MNRKTVIVIMHIVTYVLLYNDWLLLRMEKFTVKVFLRRVQNLDVIEVKYSGIRIVVVLNALWVSFTLLEDIWISLFVLLL